MPNIGTIVKMEDGRTAIIYDFSALGETDSVMFADGTVEKTDAWRIVELLTDKEQDEAEPAECELRELLQKFLARV